MSVFHCYVPLSILSYKSLPALLYVQYALAASYVNMIAPFDTEIQEAWPTGNTRVRGQMNKVRLIDEEIHESIAMLHI